MYKKTEDVLFKELLRNCQKNFPRRWDHLVSECCVVISSAYMNYMKHHVLASRGWSAPLLLEIASSKYTVTLNSLDPQIALVPCDKSQHDSALTRGAHLYNMRLDVMVCQVSPAQFCMVSLGVPRRLDPDGMPRLLHVHHHDSSGPLQT